MRQLNWRSSQAASRSRYLEKFDAAGAAAYDELVGRLGRELQDAYWQDLVGALVLRPGMRVLDAGAGTGAMCSILVREPALRLTALEPAPAMLAILRGRPELCGLSMQQGFCDAEADAQIFPAESFDAIVSRQLVNGLYDPLAAFRNWHRWLTPDGTVAVIDGFYGRSDWTGEWAEEVDCFPASASQGLALVPYLLEVAGFEVVSAGMMEAVNARPETRARRFLVVARKRA